MTGYPIFLFTLRSGASDVIQRERRSEYSYAGPAFGASRKVFHSTVGTNYYATRSRHSLERYSGEKLSALDQRDSENGINRVRPRDRDMNIDAGHDGSDVEIQDIHCQLFGLLV